MFPGCENQKLVWGLGNSCPLSFCTERREEAVCNPIAGRGVKNPFTYHLVSGRFQPVPHEKPTWRPAALCRFSLSINESAFRGDFSSGTQTNATSVAALVIPPVSAAFAATP